MKICPLIRAVSTDQKCWLTPTSFLALTEHLRQLNLLQLVEDLRIRVSINQGDSQLRLSSFPNLRVLKIECDSGYAVIHQQPKCLLLVNEVARLHRLRSLRLHCSSNSSSLRSGDALLGLPPGDHQINGVA